MFNFFTCIIAVVVFFRFIANILVCYYRRLSLWWHAVCYSYYALCSLNWLYSFQTDFLKSSAQIFL